MSLKGIKIPKSKVSIPGGGSFTVRGLSFVDLRTLFIKYGEDMSAFFDLVVNTKDMASLDVEDAAGLAAILIERAPALAAEAIAIAAGDGGESDPESFETALQLPFPVQVDALQAIGKATFGTEGGVKKFLQTAKSLLGNLQDKPRTD